MNINLLDAESVAGAVAHMAAARLYGVMTDEDGAVQHEWYRGSGADELAADAIDAHIAEMAAFVCRRNITRGEPVYIQANADQFFVTTAKSFLAEPQALRFAFDLFALVCLQTFERIHEAQQHEVRMVERASQARQPGLKKEDSILEEVDSVFDEVEHADELRAMDAKQTVKAIPNAPERHPASSRVPVTKPKAGEGDGSPKNLIEAGAMKLGEMLNKPPGKKGGRPRKGTQPRKPSRSRKSS